MTRIGRSSRTSTSLSIARGSRSFPPLIFPLPSPHVRSGLSSRASANRSGEAGVDRAIAARSDSACSDSRARRSPWATVSHRPGGTRQKVGDIVPAVVDDLRAHVRVLPVSQTFPVSDHTPSDPVTGVEHHDLVTG